MRRRCLTYLTLLIFLLSPIGLMEPACYILTLQDEENGRLIYSSCLDEGESVFYEWRNSLFGLNVTEIFFVENGSLVLREIIYHDPYGNPEPLVDPADVEHLCHEGGPFHAVNLSRAYGEVSFMVGEAGKPRIVVRDAIVDLEEEVGFGGRVMMRLSNRPLTSALSSLMPGLLPIPDLEVNIRAARAKG